MKSDNDVVITGVGIVTCHGVGKDAHIALLSSTTTPEAIVETEKFAPYPIHPLPEIDWSAQIGRKDQRQMENWQRLGGVCSRSCAGRCWFEGRRGRLWHDGHDRGCWWRRTRHQCRYADCRRSLKRNDREVMLNEKLTTELRPTLFLAQLSNLMAGNISIVHKVTGSSRTFMGEEGAGISAVETAFYRIRSGESSHALVGGAFAAERPDMTLLFEAVGAHAQGGWQPLWSRTQGEGGGMITGSVGAFLVLESRKRAEARGAKIYARIDAIEGRSWQPRRWQA